MNKKVYIEPNTKVVSMVLQHMITTFSSRPTITILIIGRDLERCIQRL